MRISDWSSDVCSSDLGEDYRTPPKYGNRFPGNPAMLRARAGSVIVGQWKLVGDQLFDLASDPDEKNDVAAQHADVVRLPKAQATPFSALRQLSRDHLTATRLRPLPRWSAPKHYRHPHFRLLTPAPSPSP